MLLRLSGATHKSETPVQEIAKTVQTRRKNERTTEDQN